ncbi:MAG: glycosyltransferase [Ginsengibacter sp.]
MEDKYVTIIIPVYNDWARLSLCLTALANQSYPAELFEIIIVNNNPANDLPPGFFIPSNCTIIKEGKAGSYAARNTALKIALGQIIGFTDSDCIPDIHWIKNAVEHFANNESCSRIGGKIFIFSKTINPTKAELYDKMYAFNQSRNVTTLGTSVTANLFTYKYVFDQIGLFDEKLMSGGDFSWGMLAHKAGYKIDYVESVIVNHPARYSLDDLITKEKRIGGAQALLFEKNKSKAANFYRFVRALVPRLQDLKYINHYGKDLSIYNKTNLFFIRHYLQTIRAYERFMVQLGRKARRH